MTSLPRKALRSLQPLVPDAPGGLVILLYHLVGAGTSSPVDVPRDLFRSQLEELRETARVVSLAQALDRLGASDPDHPKTSGTTAETTVVVTFDDAYRNFISQALPILEELAIPVTLYIPAGFVDGTAPAPIAGTGDLPAASWKELRRAVRSGLVTPGSHTVTHRDLRRLGRQEARNEVTGSRHRLEQRLDAEVETFAYPRALAPGWLTETVRAAYRSAVVAGGVKVRAEGRRWDLHALPRHPIRRDGPRELAPLLRASVWLEEWVASRLRRFRWRRWKSQGSA